MKKRWIVVLTAMLVCGGAFGQTEPPAMDVDGNGAEMSNPVQSVTWYEAAGGSTTRCTRVRRTAPNSRRRGGPPTSGFAS